jgi:hypothetical protein
MGKILRFIGILFLSISALFNIAGGVGTTCVALDPAGYEGYEAIANFQWLYILYILVTTAFGVMMVRAVVLLIKGRANGYLYALIALVGAVIVGAIHIATSRALRASGSSMPVDGVVYTTVLTLIIFLIFKIPGVWQVVDFTKAKKMDSDLAGGAAAIVCGGISLIIQVLMAPTHTINGVNYGDAFHLTTTGLGWMLILLGSYQVFKSKLDIKIPVNKKIVTKT